MKEVFIEMEANKKFSSCQARREGVRQGVCQGVRPVTASRTNIWSNTSLTVNCLTKITFQSMLVTNYWEASHCQPANKAKLLKFLVVSWWWGGGGGDHHSSCPVLRERAELKCYNWNVKCISLPIRRRDCKSSTILKSAAVITWSLMKSNLNYPNNE